MGQFIWISDSYICQHSLQESFHSAHRHRFLEVRSWEWNTILVYEEAWRRSQREGGVVIRLPLPPTPQNHSGKKQPEPIHSLRTTVYRNSRESPGIRSQDWVSALVCASLYLLLQSVTETAEHCVGLFASAQLLRLRFTALVKVAPVYKTSYRRTFLQKMICKISELHPVYYLTFCLSGLETYPWIIRYRDTTVYKRGMPGYSGSKHAYHHPQRGCMWRTV